MSITPLPSAVAFKLSIALGSLIHVLERPMLPDRVAQLVPGDPPRLYLDSRGSDVERVEALLDAISVLAFGEEAAAAAALRLGLHPGARHLHPLPAG